MVQRGPHISSTAMAPKCTVWGICGSLPSICRPLTPNPEREKTMFKSTLPNTGSSRRLGGSDKTPSTPGANATAFTDSDPQGGSLYEMTAYQAQYAETVPPKFQQLYIRALTSNSLRDAVDAMCRDCNCYEDIASRIRECHIESCPLWSHRRVGSWRARGDSYVSSEGES